MAEFTGPVTVLDPGNFSPQYTANLCSSLAQLSVDVTLITSPPQFGAMLSPRGYRVEYCFFQHLYAPGLLRSAAARSPRIRTLLKACAYPFGLASTKRLLGLQELPGVLHYQWAHWPILDHALVARLRRTGWRVVATAHEFAPPPFSSLWQPQARRFYRSVDGVVVHSARLAEKAGAELDIPRSRLHVIARGDLGVFQGAPLTREEARAQIGITGSGPVLLFFGMIKPNKGLAHLLLAMPAILGEFPDARLVIAGEPMEKFDRYRAIIQRLGTSRSVIARLGYVKDDEVSAYFQASDLVVLPHTESVLSGVVWIAMGLGRPIVGTNVGGLSDLVKDEVNGLLVPPGSPAPLAHAIVRLLRDPGQLERLGNRSRDRSLAGHQWSQTAKETLGLYRRLMNHCPSGQAKSVTSGT